MWLALCVACTRASRWGARLPRPLLWQRLRLVLPLVVPPTKLLLLLVRGAEAMLEVQAQARAGLQRGRGQVVAQLRWMVPATALAATMTTMTKTMVAMALQVLTLHLAQPLHQLLHMLLALSAAALSREVALAGREQHLGPL